MTMVSERWQTLRWGMPEGSADDWLVAAGLPDALFCDGQQLGWIDEGGLFMGDFATQRVHLLPAPGIEQVVARPERWVFLTDEPALYWGVPGQSGWSFRALPPGRYTLGSHWVHRRMGAQHQLETIEGELIPSPMGAVK
ncbi:MAG: hypothetical protein AAFV53_32230, partial [Myxococcota bacterium]